MSERERNKAILDRLRVFLDEASDATVLEMVPNMDRLKQNNPLVYQIIEPLWLVRLAQARKS